MSPRQAWVLLDRTCAPSKPYSFTYGDVLGMDVAFVTWQNDFISYTRKIINGSAVVKRNSAHVCIYSQEDMAVD